MVETRFQTSFIPKRPVASGVAYRGEPSHMGFLGLIALILVIAAAVVSGGLFFYEQFLNSSIASKDEELVVVLARLDKKALETFTDLGKKTQSAQTLLSRHPAFSRVTDFLAATTLTNVRFKDLTFDSLPGNPARVTLKGEAQGYAAVASQSNAFATANGVRSVSFSNLTLDEKGNVTFIAKLELDPTLFVYTSRASDSLSLSLFGPNN